MAQAEFRVRINPRDHWAKVSLTETFVGELSMHRVPRSLFDLIPGKAQEVRDDLGSGVYWTKSLRMQCGQSSVPLTVFCDEPSVLG